MQFAQRFLAIMRDQTFLPAIYPALFAHGVDEGSLHAWMLSALVLVGDRMGFTPVADSPVFDRLDKLLLGEGAKRPDAVWYARGRQDICCLIEFERYTTHALAPKAKNLLIMGKELPHPPQLAVLNYWTYNSLPAAALQDVQTVFACGFHHPSSVMFPPLSCPAFVLETLVVRQRHFTSVQHMAPRLFISEGEDKPYLVKQLGNDGTS